MNAQQGQPRDLPTWLWLWFPPPLLLVQYSVRIYDHALYRRVIEGERGFVELATPCVLLVGVVAGIAVLRRRHSLPDKRLAIWLALVVLGCIYFAGEELSWGQHLFGWQTPPLLEAINDQEETNVHNISSWFDQKPRLLLELWVLIGGVLYPFAHRAEQSGDPLDWRTWFWPTHVVLPSAALAILIRVPERLKPLFDVQSWPLEIRYSEPQEYYFGLFLALYSLSIWYRLRTLERGSS